jgi:chromosome segregation ATPase
VSETPDVIALRRKLQSLESQLTKEKDTTKALRSERTTLKRRVTTLDKQNEKVKGELEKTKAELKSAQQEAKIQLETCQKELKAMTKAHEDHARREEQLIAENRRLAESMGTVENDLKLFQEKAAKAAEDVKAAQEQTAARLNARHENEKQQLQNQQEQLQKQVTLLSKQLEEEGRVILMSPERVASLMGELVQQMDSQMPGMKLSTGEVKLKVAFGGVGEISGFAVPTPDAPAELRENLHEVTIRFDRAATFTPEIPVEKP